MQYESPISCGKKVKAKEVRRKNRLQLLSQASLTSVVVQNRKLKDINKHKNRSRKPRTDMTTAAQDGRKPALYADDKILKQRLLIG